MATFVVGELQVTDPEPFSRYLERVTATVERYGGRYVAAGQVVDVLEGDFRPHAAAVIAFDRCEDARRWYESEEYRAIRGLRQSSGRTSVVVVEQAGGGPGS